MNLVVKFVLVAFSSMICLSAHAQKGEKMAVLATHTVTVENTKKLDAKTSFIATEKDWKAAWEKLGTQDKLPEVDFGKNFVFIDSVDPKDPNRRSLSILKSEKGELSANAVSTLIGFQPSGSTKYNFLVLSREGVKGISRYDVQQKKFVIDPFPEMK